jgi:hypothetical protein
MKGEYQGRVFVEASATLCLTRAIIAMDGTCVILQSPMKIMKDSSESEN